MRPTGHCGLRRRQAVRESEPHILQGYFGRIGCFTVGSKHSFVEKVVEPLHPDGILREGYLQPGNALACRNGSEKEALSEWISTAPLSL